MAPAAKIDIVDAETLRYEDFCAKYMSKNCPVKIQNVTTRWFANAVHWTTSTGGINYEYLRHKYADALAPIVDGDVVEYGGEARSTMRFADYLDLLQQKKAGKRYLKDWHCVREFGTDLYTTPVFFQDDWLNWWWDRNRNRDDDYRFVYIGPAGSWTPLHHDVFRSYSWSVNITGRKQWIFFHQDEELKLKDRFGRYLIPDVTAKDIDKEQFPNFHQATPIYIIQEANEAIFVPSGWYHQVENLEDTISINHNWFNGYCLREIWRFLQREYAAVEQELEHLKEMGLVGWEFEQQCQLVMNANTGMNYEEFRQLLYAKAAELLPLLEPVSEGNAHERGLLKQQEARKHLHTISDVLKDLQIYFNAQEGTGVQSEWLEMDQILEQL